MDKPVQAIATVLCPKCARHMLFLDRWEAPDFVNRAICDNCEIAFQVRAEPVKGIPMDYPSIEERARAL